MVFRSGPRRAHPSCELGSSGGTRYARAHHPPIQNVTDLTSLLAINLFAASFMAGLLWFVQVVHYPLLANVPADLTANTAVRHQKLTGRVVGPVMAVEVGSAVALAVAPPGGQWQAWLLIALVLLLVALGVTIFVSVPLHAKMAAGQNGPVTQRLVLSNWIRTTAWSGRAILLTLLAIRAL